MNPTLAYLVLFLTYIFLAFSQVLGLLAYLLVWIWKFISFLVFKPITTLLYVLALPALYLASWIGSLLTLGGAFLQRFETLYVYLGTAALIGAVSGMIMFLMSTGLISVLGLESKSESMAPPRKVRSISEYRAQRKKKLGVNGHLPLELDLSSSAGSTTLVEGKGKARRSKWTDRGLASPTTIVEEDDSDEV